MFEPNPEDPEAGPPLVLFIPNHPFCIEPPFALDQPFVDGLPNPPIGICPSRICTMERFGVRNQMFLYFYNPLLCGVVRLVLRMGRVRYRVEARQRVSFGNGRVGVVDTRIRNNQTPYRQLFSGETTSELVCDLDLPDWVTHLVLDNVCVTEEGYGFVGRDDLLNGVHMEGISVIERGYYNLAAEETLQTVQYMRDYELPIVYPNEGEGDRETDVRGRRFAYQRMSERFYPEICGFSMVDGDTTSLKFKVLWHLEGTGPGWCVKKLFYQEDHSRC